MVENEGVKVSLVSAGKYKTEGNPFEPLTDEAREAIQEMVDDYYSMFINAVARNRGVSASDVRGGFGEGRVVSADKAVALGMVDRVGSFSEVISEQAGRRPSRSTFALNRHKLEIEKMKGGYHDKHDA
jgi:ClpP class serine protease